jgi:hypothetical protein
MKTFFRKQPQPARAIAKQHQPFTENFKAQGITIRHRHLIAHTDRIPEAPENAPHGRTGTHPAQQLILAFAEHAYVSP